MVKRKNLSYEEVAGNIIASIDGKRNINSVRHRITRIRFRLKDESRADGEIVKSLEEVPSVVHGGGKYMTVIGDAVGGMYDAVCVQLGMQDGTGNGTKAEEGKKMDPVMRVLGMTVGAVLPCLSTTYAGGIVKGLQTVPQMTGMVPPGSGMDLTISTVKDAIFFLLPIFLGMGLAKALKGDGSLGVLIGTILCYPTINGVNLGLSRHTINATYTSSSLPVIAVTTVAILLTGWLNKYIPKVVANFVTPVIILAAVVPFGFILIEPAVNMAGSLANTGITALPGIVPLLAGIILSALYQVMVLFGIHTVLILSSFISLLGGDPSTVMAISYLVYFAQTGVTLGIYCKIRDRRLKSIAFPAFISGLFGIVEPVIYGMALPRIKMSVLPRVEADIIGVIIMLTGTKTYSSGFGVFVVLGMVNPEAPNLIPPLLAVAVPPMASFMLVYVLHKDKAVPASDSVQITPDSETATHEKFIIESPVPGKVVLISQVPDEAFSSGILDKGFAVEPSEGKVYAPFGSTHMTIFETLHAMDLESGNGVNLLVCVGPETVGLSGEPFKAHVDNGDNIKKGQLLLEFNMDEIKAAGCPVITSVLVADENEVGRVAIENDKTVVGG